MLDYREEARISGWALMLVALLVAIAATQYWGYYPYSTPSLRELTTIGVMIREGQLNHPLSSYYRMLPAIDVFGTKLLGSGQFNFWLGMLTKLSQLILSFFLIKQITKNQIVIFFVILLVTVGFYVELHPFIFTVKHPTYYGFRYVASTIILGSLLLIFRKQFVWASILIGISFFFHPKVGVLSLILLPSTVMLYQYSSSRSLRAVGVSAIKLVAPSVIVIVGILQFTYFQTLEVFFHYWGNSLHDGISDFPTYLMALKIEPDDYFFFDNYANLTPEIFKGYSPNKFILLIFFLGIFSLIGFWKIERTERSISKSELMIVVLLYCFTLYFSRMSTEILVFLGLINSACYLRYVRDHNGRGRGNLLAGNPVGMFSLVVTLMFVIGISMEYLIAFVPGWIAPLIYTFKIWKAPHFNTLIGTVFLGIIVLRALDIQLQSAFKRDSIRFNLDFIAITISGLFVFGSGFLQDSSLRNDTLMVGFDIYRPLFKNEQVPIRRGVASVSMDQEFVYREKRVTRVERSDIFDKYLADLRQINKDILDGNISAAENQLDSIDITQSPFLLTVRDNAKANLMAARGKIHQAHKVYRLANNTTAVSKNEYPIPLDRDSFEYRFPEKIPGPAYADAIVWIRENINRDAVFLNAPHIDGFTERTGRNAFFPMNKFELESTPLNGDWAGIYLRRQRSVLGMTVFDLPGIIHGNLTRPQIRYAFLRIGNKRIEELQSLFPEIHYVFTENNHELPYKVVFSNGYFVIYELSQVEI
jgi:hypothetical protein